jgi:hypothetical protein
VLGIFRVAYWDLSFADVSGKELAGMRSICRCSYLETFSFATIEPSLIQLVQNSRQVGAICEHVGTVR